MLFDLRGRGRRRTVQAVYLGLALLIGGGLVLFGVGTGTGGGGLLNGIGGNGGNNQSQVVNQQVASAEKAVKRNPSDPQAWASMVQARWTAAGQGSNYNAATQSFTASGKQQLTGATQAWERYLQLTKTPDSNLAVLAARAYGALANYSGEAKAWEIVTAATPDSAHGFECLAVSAYAAKNNRLGDLATTKAITLVPKAQRTLLKSQINAAKTQPLIAQSC
jgi:hypothetical protein